MSENNNKNGTIFLASILISFAIILTSSIFNIAIVDPDSEFTSLTLYEQSLNDGIVYIAGNEEIIPNNGVIYIVAETNSNCINMYERLIQLESVKDLDVNIELYENVDFTNGILIENFNKNRNFEDNSTFKIYNINNEDVDLTGAYKLPFNSFLKGDKISTVRTSNSADYIMKKNTKYALKIINNNNELVDLYFTWNWLECAKK